MLIDKTISTESKIIREVFGLIVMLQKSLKFEKYIHVMQPITKTKLQIIVTYICIIYEGLIRGAHGRLAP